MNDFTDRLRAAADYIDKHSVPRLLSVRVDTGVVDFHGSPFNSNRMAVFLRWADTLDGDTALIAVPREKNSTVHLYARGRLPGSDLAAELCVIVDSADYPTLTETLGAMFVDANGDVPVTRQQLEKIAGKRAEAIAGQAVAVVQ